MRDRSAELKGGMQDTDKRTIVSTKALRRVSLINSGHIICIEFEQPGEEAAFVFVPTQCGADLIEALRSALHGSGPGSEQETFR